ncbi:hypothetical protein P4O66_000331 [Electrophorus voltai]|uniref:CUB domain-containing protein n=1 Tax=Electrophorus voltai TaxID=2609070 RepID=A0AAD8ZLJ0_9TELE|nr:hypothetical protein P4O66_000331 [Electrophorus voltai]
MDANIILAKQSQSHWLRLLSGFLGAPANAALALRRSPSRSLHCSCRCHLAALLAQPPHVEPSALRMGPDRKGKFAGMGGARALFGASVCQPSVEGEDFGPRDGEVGSERRPFTTKQDSPIGLQEITTALALSLPNHQPNLGLPEALLTKDFVGDQPFFGEGGEVEDHATPSGRASHAEPRDHTTPVVPHEDAPAFSDIATTAATTTSPTAPGKPASVDHRRPSKGGGRQSAKVELTSPVLMVAGNTAQPSPGQPLDLTRAEAELSEQGAVPEQNGSRKKASWRPPEKSMMGKATGADEEETMTSTIVTTTVITTTRATGQCNLNFTDAEGYIEMPYGGSYDSTVDCTSLITVYLGYGVEIQVLNVTLEGGEEVVLEDLGGPERSILANGSTLHRGMVLWSSSNQISVRFSSEKQPRPGSLLLLRYRAKSVCTLNLQAPLQLPGLKRLARGTANSCVHMKIEPPVAGQPKLAY